MRYLNRAAAAAVLFFLSSVTHSASPPKILSATELDSVSAGYLTVEMIALADAYGPVTETYTFTNSEVKQLEKSRGGYLYTVGKGRAVAIAKGSEVFTFADGMIDTDEEIVSIKVVYKKNTKHKAKNNSKKNKHKNRKKKNSGKRVNRPKRSKAKSGISKEKSVYRIRVVTRVPEPAS